MKGSDLFIRALENEGVKCIFGIPGEETLDILDSIKHSSIKLVLTRHEQGAGFMAATYGRLTGKAGVCLSTLGPGATNLVTPAAYANLGGMPMLMITGQKPIRSSLQGQFQMVNVVEMMQPLVKYTKQIVDASSIPYIVREAFRLAEEERPGAVHIEFPEDIASTSSDAHIFNKPSIFQPRAHPDSITEAAEMIKNASRPLLLIGAGANRKRTSIALKNFIDKTQIPFFNTQMGKGVVDERHHLFMGTAALSDHDYLHIAIDYADLIINVGHDVIEKPPFFMHPDGHKVIHINFFSAEVDDAYFPQVEVVGDIAPSINRLNETIDKHDISSLGDFMKLKEHAELHIQERSETDTFPMLPQRIVADVRKAMPDDGIIALDNGVYKIWFARNYKAYKPNTILLDNALGTMGAGLPSAMAAKMLNQDRKVVAICGDGGFMMNSQELETAVRLELDLTILVLRDNAYGMIKWKQAGRDFDDYGLDFSNPDFIKYAEAYGAMGHRISSANEFQPILKECIAASGVHLIDIPVDYSENERVLIDELKSSTHDILSHHKGELE